jgi:S1-C subfamily serine protease
VDLNGHVIGINSAIYSRSGGYQGIGFAIPINQARKIAEKLIKSGEVVRGWMGIEVRELKEAEAKRLGLADGVGLSVEGIYMRGPAQKGGIEPDDVVVAIDGHPLRSAAELRDLVADKDPDSKIQVKLFRKGKEKAVEVILATQPRSWGTGRPER